MTINYQESIESTIENAYKASNEIGSMVESAMENGQDEYLEDTNGNIEDQECNIKALEAIYGCLESIDHTELFIEVKG